MTLGIGIITHDYAYLVSDRRTTSAGLPTNDEFDKVCYIATVDARMAFSFAGLAYVRSYNSKVRLIENLMACAPPDFVLPEIIKRYTTILNDEFSKHPDIKAIRQSDRRFSLLGVGFRRQWNIDFPCFAMISNFQDIETDTTSDVPWPEFRPFLSDLPWSRPAHSVAIGQANAMDFDVWYDLVRSSQGLRPNIVTARLVRQVQQASKREMGIGGQVSSIVVPRAFRSEATTNYHVLTCQRSVYSPAMINAERDPATCISASSFSFNDPNGPIICTPVTGRNKQCPCGSKRKFRHCHDSRNSLELGINHFPGREVTYNGRSAPPDPETLIRERKQRRRKDRKDRKVVADIKSHRLRVLARIDQLSVDENEYCPLCNDTAWVCDKHLDRPWQGRNACNCGNSGAPCWACNYPTRTKRQLRRPQPGRSP